MVITFAVFCSLIEILDNYLNFRRSDLVNVFEVFIPQLLLYPNPSDPLNDEAAALMMRDRIAYELKVKGIEIFTLMACLISDCLHLLILQRSKSYFNFNHIS